MSEVFITMEEMTDILKISRAINAVSTDLTCEIKVISEECGELGTLKWNDWDEFVFHPVSVESVPTPIKEDKC